MAFFLIGRGPGDELRLLSSRQFDSRQDAMAELSLLSADPAFVQWDAEVTVMDLATGAPVLLVRPAAGQPASAADAEGDADAWEADLPAEVPAPEELSVPLDAIELADTEVSLVEIPDAIPEAIEADSWEPPAVALIEPVGDEAIANMIVEEATARPDGPSTDAQALTELQSEVRSKDVPEPEIAPVADVEAMTGTPLLITEFSADAVPVLEEPAAETAMEESGLESADDNDELRAAILRTTAQMSAEGIVPPESVGFDEPVAEAVADARTQPVELTEPAELVAPADSYEPASTFPETVFAEALAATTATREAAPVEVAPEPAAWPWVAPNAVDGEVAPEVAGVYDALEQPASELPEPDLEAVLRASVFVAPVEGVGAENDSPAKAPMSALPGDLDAEGSEFPGDASDFILDLESVEGESRIAVTTPDATSDVASEPTLAEAPAYEPSASPVDDFTCGDCVYMDTCPNRDQRLPKDCGSFQWR